ncbi:MAG: glutaredoxin domain-containing protein [archaeon]|nr:glutathione S-transferase N-terminal domain-containing protein [Candidatus Micrarchaeota archaeon]
MNVTIYSTRTCPYCVMAKQFFKEKGIEFKDYDVSEDHSKAKEMMDKTGQMGVPVIDINGKVIVGFDKPKIEALLNLK